MGGRTSARCVWRLGQLGRGEAPSVRCGLRRLHFHFGGVGRGRGARGAGRGRGALLQPFVAASAAEQRQASGAWSPPARGSRATPATPVTPSARAGIAIPSHTAMFTSRDRASQKELHTARSPAPVAAPRDSAQSTTRAPADHRAGPRGACRHTSASPTGTEPLTCAQPMASCPSHWMASALHCTPQLTGPAWAWPPCLGGADPRLVAPPRPCLPRPAREPRTGAQPKRMRAAPHSA